MGVMTNPQDAEALLSEVVRRIVATAQPRMVILFGSYSRGTQTPDSDIDILIIEESVRSKYVEILRLRRALRGLLAPFDILVASKAEFDVRSKIPGTIHFWARTEGRVLHDAA